MTSGHVTNLSGIPWKSDISVMTSENLNLPKIINIIPNLAYPSPQITLSTYHCRIKDPTIPTRWEMIPNKKKREIEIFKWMKIIK